MSRLVHWEARNLEARINQDQAATVNLLCTHRFSPVAQNRVGRSHTGIGKNLVQGLFKFEYGAAVNPGAHYQASLTARSLQHLTQVRANVVTQGKGCEYGSNAGSNAKYRHQAAPGMPGQVSQGKTQCNRHPESVTVRSTVPHPQDNCRERNPRPSPRRYNDGVITTDEAVLPGTAALASLELRQASQQDTELIQELYLRTPGYFEIISIPQPVLTETEVELSLALGDERRYVEVITARPELAHDWDLLDPVSGRPAVGLLDYKLDYPGQGDATVNLILIPASLQGRGFGREAVRTLEDRLRGRCQRMLAAIYGQNNRAQRFWVSLGYHFAIDAKPNLDWYAKELAV